MIKQALKIVCTSDTNGSHEGLEQLKGDLLIHCGDFTKSGTEGEVYKFIEWLSKLNFTWKVIIAGHKEMTFDLEKYNSHLRKIFHNGFPQYDGQVYKNQLQAIEGVHYLEHESVEIQGVRIFGSPYQPVMFDCAFGREPTELQKIWQPVKEPIDILVTHCPPYGIMDEYKATNTGCKHVLKKVEELKPKYHIFGHNRERYGQVERNGTTFVNCCRFDAKFQPVNPPVEIHFTFDK